MRITCSWNTSRNEEAKITLNGIGPDIAPDLATLDFLKDCVIEISQLYNNQLELWQSQMSKQGLEQDRAQKELGYVD